MAYFVSPGAPINRQLGYVDCDDATNLPVGVGAIVRNTAFDLVSARTRDGFNATMTGLNKSPISGLIGITYTPETDTESFFQLPVIFDLAGSLQYEAPVGSGNMVKVPQGQFTPPANAHMIAVQPYNKLFAAFSNLNVPSSQMAVLDPKTLTLDGYGMKQFGWIWLPATQVLVGEVSCPTKPGGNGHTYRCIAGGTTGNIEPGWPQTENGLVVDGSVTWEEYTAVMANCVPAPVAPLLTRESGAGSFAAGLDVYFVITFTNIMGETLPSIAAVLSDTVLNDAIIVHIPTLASLPGWERSLGAYLPTAARIYAATVSTGSPAPPQTTYEYVGTSPLGFNAPVTAPPSVTVYPPTINSARITPGQLPTPVVGPTIQRISTAGSFPVGRDVYVLQTYVNSAGETPAGPANSILNTELDDQIGVTVAGVTAYPQIETVGIYEADVATGQPAPNSSQFALVGYYTPGATPTISAAATGPPPPIVNGTGPAGNIVADNPQGGINGSQGYRYAAIMFMNRNFSVSGFTPASVIKYIVDEDGWELSIFNVATGPSNIIARINSFTVADGTNAGDFWWIGNIDPLVANATFAYPDAIVDAGILQYATVFNDNTTTQGTFNFSDEYLIASNNVTDRLDIIWPAPCVHIAYHPSIDRMVQTGIYGNWSGCRVSLAGAPEDYYADLSDIPIESADGERAWGTFEYKQVSYLIRERSGFALQASPSNPNEWSARRRWSKVGACGPRAFDSCDDFFMFVHRSGIYRYEDTNPDLMTKEIPYWWQTVNWAAATTISIKIDRETHTVHINVPVGNSAVPNQKVTINYNEGWANPIHYGVMSGKEISMDACRKISIDDCAAFVCDRIERQLPAPPTYVQGDAEIPLLSSSFQSSQFVFGSSGPDGTINAITPGIFSDNGSGIDWQYETVCPEGTMALSKIEGFQLNAKGNGKIYPRLIGGRKMLFDTENGQVDQLWIPLPAMDLNIEQSEGISYEVEERYNEKWRVGFSNGKVPGAWASIKWISIFAIPFFTAHEGGEAGGF